MYDQAKLKAPSFKEGRSFWNKCNIALNGIKYAWRTERGMRSHFLLTIIVLLAALTLDVDTSEFLFLTLAFILLLVAEMFNTAIELTVDLSTIDPVFNAKTAKDVAAGAVSIALLGSIIISIIVLYPHIITIINKA